MKNYKSVYSVFVWALGFSFVSMNSLHAQKEVKLWESGVPNSKIDAAYQEVQHADNGQVYGVDKVTDPTLTIYEPEAGKANGTAVVICPGGGYGHLAIIIISVIRSLWVFFFFFYYAIFYKVIYRNKIPCQEPKCCIWIYNFFNIFRL